MKIILLCGILSFLLSFLSGLIIIPLLKKIKAGQTILKYVENHKDKNGTPTMGGLFFIIASVLIYFSFYGISSRLATVSCVIGMAFMLVGFLDDFIKIKYHKNEGLKPYQKIMFQFIISVFAGVFAFSNGIVYFHIPFVKKVINFGYFTIFLVAFIFIAMTNSVNLTDGLDGLAGTVSVTYLISICSIIFIEQKNKALFLSDSEFNGMIMLSFCLIGAILGFLIFNVSKAKVFMGDTGSLALGGFLASISIFTSNSLFVPVIGIMFVLSSISVIIQVIHYKRTKNRVFLMAPLHHHFQLKGYTETQISFCYGMITFLIGSICIISYL